MNSEEKKELKTLTEAMWAIKSENTEFRKQLTERIEKTEKLVESKHMPVFLEKDVLSSVQSSIHKAIESTMTGYSSPLTKLISSVVDQNSIKLREIISSAFEGAIATDNFKQAVFDAFTHKISRGIISGNDSLFEKVTNELKQDASFMAKVTLAIDQTLKEFIKDKHNA